MVQAVASHRLLGRVRPSRDKTALCAAAFRRPGGMTATRRRSSSSGQGVTPSGRLEDKTSKLIRDDRLYPATPAADDPDPARHHADLVHGRAIRPRRTGRAHHRPAQRRRYRRASRISGRRRRLRRARAVRSGGPADAANSKYRGAQGLDPEFIASLEKQFGFDKPAYERFCLMLWNYAGFDFGKSYFRDTSVLDLDQGEAAGLDLARPLADPADLSDLDPARHPQGGAGRLAVRRLDVGRHHRRLFDSRASCSRSCSSSCSPAARSTTGFRCAGSPRRIGRNSPGGRRCSIISGT